MNHFLHASWKPLFFLFIILIAGTHISRAQTLEEVNFGTQAFPINTYLTDINNAGFVCGYYDTSGQTNGFVINPDGKIRRFIGTAGSTTKVEGINNNNVVLINQTVGGVTTVFKAYYNTATQDYNTPVAVSNIQQSTAIPFGINNINDIVGWYQGPAERWVWVAHDSIVPPGNTAWMANRYSTTGPTTYYNTQGGGINDNNLAVGFWFSGIVITPVLYNVIANTFTNVTNPPATKCRLWDINNNQIAVGEYLQANGYYSAFYAPVTTGGFFTQVHSLNTLFQSATIQSVANGINDNGDIAGSYLHPTTGTWVGFIYRPLQNGYRLPGYDWTKHSWSMKNNQTSPNSVWTSNFYGTYDYRYSDPFTSLSTQALFDTFMVSAYPGIDTHNYNYLCADWKSFAKEIDTGNVLASPNYQVWKHVNASKWLNSTAYNNVFNGICYGFAYTSLLKYRNDTNLNYFGIPSNANLYSYTNTSNNEITAITRTYLKQYDQARLTPYLPSQRFLVKPWSGLYRLKNTYMDTDPVRRNPRAVYIKLSNGWHSILPYKINTPKLFPFNYNGVIAKDTLFVYDSNRPGDSTQYFLVNATTINVPIDSATNPTYPNLRQLCFNEASVQEMMPVHNAALKSTGYQQDTFISAYLNPLTAYYQITGTGGTASYNVSGHSNTIPFLTEAEQKDDNIVKPKYYNMDTSHNILVSSSNYTENKMLWSITNTHKVMGLSRIAAPGETDYGKWTHRLMTYGTHDAATKTLSGYFMEMDDGLTQGVNTLVTSLTMKTGDSLLTENPSRYVYKITRLGSTTDTYNVWVYTAGADSMRIFRTNGITLAPNSSHTILPYYGPTGKQVIILIDLGNNGTVDDTVKIAQTSLGVHGIFQPDGSIRIYPNPAGDYVTVSIGHKATGYTVAVTDYTGKTLYAKPVTGNNAANTVEIPIGSFTTGIYLIQVRDELGRRVFTDKFLKQ